MSFLRDRQEKIFFAGVLLVCLTMIAGALLFCRMTGDNAKSMMLEHDRCVASVLLEKGVDQEVILQSLNSRTESAEGKLLLQKAGRTEETAFLFYPQIKTFFRRVAWVILPGAAVLVLFLAGITWGFLALRERLYESAVKEVAKLAEGDYSRRLPQAAGGTLSLLFSSVDHLAAALRAKEEGERASRVFLKNTISDISHQLKTPLAALNMYQEIISEEPENRDTVLQFSEKAGNALDRMERLIQSLLKITRLDAGSIVFEKEVCPLRELARRAAGELFTRAEAESKELLLEGDPTLSLICDPQWTSEALANLLKNALDHTSPGGHIRLFWERTPAMLRIVVRDDGGGIAPGDMPHIFKRFYRSSRSLDKAGIGLGLPLAKAIIEGQGGVLSVQSAPGAGSDFTVSFLTEL